MPVSCQCSNWLQNLLPNDWDEAGARFACSDESEIGAGFLKSIYAASFWHMYQGPIDSVRSETMLIVISVLFIIFENFMCSWETCCLCYFCHSVAHSCDCSGFMSRQGRVVASLLLRWCILTLWQCDFIRTSRILRHQYEFTYFLSKKNFVQNSMSAFSLNRLFSFPYPCLRVATVHSVCEWYWCYLNYK